MTQNAKVEQDKKQRDEQAQVTELELAELKSRKLFRAGIGMFAGLGVYTAAWLIFTSHWPPLIYMFVMIPVSAIGMGFIFRGFTGIQQHGVLQRIDSGNAVVLGQLANVHGEVTMVRRDLNALEHRQDKTDEAVEELAARQEATACVTESLVKRLEELVAEVDKIRGSEESAYLAGFNDGTEQNPPDPDR